MSEANPSPRDSAQLPPLTDTEVARVFRQVYGGTRYDATQRMFAAEIAHFRDAQWNEALRAQAAGEVPVGTYNGSSYEAVAALISDLDGLDQGTKLYAAPQPQAEAASVEPVLYQARVRRGTEIGGWNTIDATKTEPTPKLRAAYLADIKNSDGTPTYEVRTLYAGAPPAPVPADAEALCDEYVRAGYRERDASGRMDGHTKWQVWRDAVTWCQEVVHPPQPQAVAATSPATAVDARVPVDEVLEIVESYGPWGKDINDSLQFQIILADEVRRLRVLYELAVAGRREMRAALQASRQPQAQQGGGDVAEALTRILPYARAALANRVMTADVAGQVEADMRTLAALATKEQRS